jgi:hypothetical protein
MRCDAMRSPGRGVPTAALDQPAPGSRASPALDAAHTVDAKADEHRSMSCSSGSKVFPDHLGLDIRSTES